MADTPRPATSALDAIRRYHGDLTAIRHDIHAHPELGMEEHRTAELVARQLEAMGIEVHRGVGGTGVVGVLRSGNGHACIGGLACAVASMVLTQASASSSALSLVVR